MSWWQVAALAPVLVRHSMYWFVVGGAVRVLLGNGTVAAT